MNSFVALPEVLSATVWFSGFLRPWALLLLPLPIIVWHIRKRSRPIAGVRLPERLYGLLSRVPASHSSSHQKKQILLSVCGWIALVLALAAPLSRAEPQQFSTGRDLLLAIDLSASMRAKDVQLNGREVDRYTAVKSLAGDFIRRREGDRVGLMVFADRAFLLAPLTYDVGAVSGFLDEVQVGLPGRKTAIGDAIGLAIKTLQKQPLAARVIILLSDGDSNSGVLSPEASAQLATTHKVRIHTIGFGIAEGPVDLRNGLKSIAESTGGNHFTARTTGSLREVYAEIDQLEPTETTQRVFAEQDYVSELLLLSAIMLALLMLLDWRNGQLT